MRFFFVSLMLAIIGFWILPSAYLTGDMAIHTLFIRKLQDSSLWQKDYTNNYQLKQNSISIYYPAVAVFSHFLPLTYLQDMRILFYFYLVLFFWGLLLLGYEWEGSIWSGLILSLLVLSKFHIGGAAIETMETDFVPRGMSMVAIIWSLYFYIKGKRVITASLIGFSLLMHMLTGFYASWLYMMHFALKKWSILTRGKWLIAGVFFLSVVFLVFTGFKIDDTWLGVLRLRNSYAFLTLWTPKSWINLIIALIPGCIYLYMNRTKGDRTAQLYILAIGGSLILTLLNLVFTSIYPIHEVIILQFGRSWILAVYASLFGGTVLILRQIRERARVVLAALLLLSVVYFNYLRAPLKLDTWQEVSSWARNSTSKNCIFLTPFITVGFRVESERAIVGDYKDGTLSFYSREFAIEWKKRYEDLKNWEDASSSQLHKLQKIYGFNYIVSQKNLDGYPILYKNAKYTVYGVQSTSECKVI